MLADLAGDQLRAALTGGLDLLKISHEEMLDAGLVASDAVARTMLAPVQLPVGVVTTALGGIYLLGLLIAQSRKAAS